MTQLPNNLMGLSVKHHRNQFVYHCHRSEQQRGNNLMTLSERLLLYALRSTSVIASVAWQSQCQVSRFDPTTHVGFLCKKFYVYPGEGEMEALALGVLRVLKKEEEPKIYE